MPLLFSWTIGQPSTLSVSIRFGPRTISSTDIAPRPMRWVNQLESGTSSTVLMLTAGISLRSPGLRNVCSAKSNALLPSIAFAAPASSARSSSTCTGSSGKNFGAAALPPRTSVAAHAMETPHAANRLEHIAKPENEVLTGTAAKCSLDAQEDAVSRPESEADAVVRLEVAQIQIFDARGHLARIVEQRAVDGCENLPAVLRLQQQQMSIAE